MIAPTSCKITVTVETLGGAKNFATVEAKDFPRVLLNKETREVYLEEAFYLAIVGMLK